MVDVKASTKGERLFGSLCAEHVLSLPRRRQPFIVASLLVLVLYIIHDSQLEVAVHSGASLRADIGL